MPEWLVASWPHISSGTAVLIAVVASAHVILFHRDERASVGWVGVIWLVPFVGALLYVLLGVNRIRRTARAMWADAQRFQRNPDYVLTADEDGLPEAVSELEELCRLMDRVTPRPLLRGNRIEPLVDGDEAYPEMLAAIDAAERSIALSTYIFDNDPVGRRFAEALARAVKRGVEVRVIIDDAGARYSRPPIGRQLKRAGVPVKHFMPAWVPWRMPYLNLRTHRKILVVDGTLGFSGGMNIRAGHLLSEKPRYPIRDVMFRIEGPVVRQLVQVFAEDWRFTAKETLSGEAWFPDPGPVGDVPARGIADGPDEDIDVIRWTLLGAIASARKSIRVVTPYFLPDISVVTALSVAAMRGVRVDIVLPERGNLRVVQWAMWSHLVDILVRGVTVHLTPAPFDHSKLMVVDDAWVLLGSTNWDPRSLRLNFEFNVECYDHELAERVSALISERVASARILGPEELRQRPLPVKLRDGIARLLTPYL